MKTNDPAQPSRDRPPRSSRRVKAVVAAAVLAIAAAFVIFMRSGRRSPETAIQTTPTVAVAPVTRKDLFQELAVQAEFRPYQEIQVYSKVAGYLKSISVDIGDRVRAGDLIATVEVPELQNERDHAVAAEERAEVDYRSAHLDYTRLAEVLKSQPNLVAQQDIDVAEGRDRSLAAGVTGAKADVERYQTLIAYTKITAPFDGVVTARTADPGAMIQAASSSSLVLPLIRLSQNDRLRLDFPVSVSFVESIAIGDPVEVRLEGSNRVLPTKITRFTRKVSTATRTMETEVEVPNPDLKLIPGMYATVVLKLNQRPGAVAVPIEAVGAGGSPSVYLVNANHVVEERPVKLGLQTASYYEVLSGLQPGDLVVVGSRSGIQPGTTINPLTLASISLP